MTNRNAISNGTWVLDLFNTRTFCFSMIERLNDNQSQNERALNERLNVFVKWIMTFYKYTSYLMSIILFKEFWDTKTPTVIDPRMKKTIYTGFIEALDKKLFNLNEMKIDYLRYDDLTDAMQLDQYWHIILSCFYSLNHLKNKHYGNNEIFDYVRSVLTGLDKFTLMMGIIFREKQEILSFDLGERGFMEFKLINNLHLNGSIYDFFKAVLNGDERNIGLGSNMMKEIIKNVIGNEMIFDLDRSIRSNLNMNSNRPSVIIDICSDEEDNEEQKLDDDDINAIDVNELRRRSRSNLGRINTNRINTNMNDDSLLNDSDVDIFNNEIMVPGTPPPRNRNKNEKWEHFVNQINEIFAPENIFEGLDEALDDEINTSPQIEMEHKNENENELCCICRESNTNEMVPLPCDVHKLHRLCALRLIEHGDERCPMCRYEFDDNWINQLFISAETIDVQMDEHSN